MSELRTLFLSFGSWAIAAMIFFLVTVRDESTWKTVLGAILVAPVFCLIFGWIYFLIAVYLHFAGHSLWPWFRIRSYSKRKFSFLGSLFAALLWSLIGSKEEGSVLRFTVAYAVAAFVSAFFALHLIATFRDDDDGWPVHSASLGALSAFAGPTKRDWWVALGGLGALLMLVLVMYLREGGWLP